MKKLFLLVCTFAMLLCSCRHNATTEATARTFTDDYGREVQLPAELNRVVSVSPAITEIMFALGAQDLLVGRTDFCTYPSQALTIPSVGGISNLNIEQVVSLNPDMVIGASMIPQQSADKLTELGVPLACVIEKQHFDDLFDNISKVGYQIGRESRADSLNEVLKSRLASLPDSASWPAYEQRPSIYYVVGFGKGGNYTAGGNTFINDIIRRAGGRNMADQIEGWNISLELLMSDDPDWVMVREEDRESFCKMSPYSTLTAVKKGRVIALPSGLLDLQTPRNIDAVMLINECLNRH